jgi:2-polyprenyl-6-methoxyphenol hydroxylase-like FAD-dependent oxidoreductase
LNNRSVLIVGLGISGMACAIGLARAGWRPTIIERAPQRRSGGYFVGLFPEGKEAAREMEIYDAIHVRTPRGGANWDLRPDGTRSESISFLDQPGEPDAVLRGDIEAGLWDSLASDTEVRFATVPIAISDQGDHVLVTLENTATGERSTERFGLVVGADGMRSTVRQMVFGPHEDYLRSLGAIVCAYEFGRQVPSYGEQDSLVIAESGRALWVLPYKDRPPTAMLTYRTRDVDAEFARPVAEVVRERYAGMSANGLLEHALDELHQAEAPLFDSVHQVRMDCWSKGRVVLAGDAAWCLTLYSGMGASMGIKSGMELGKAFAHHGDDVAAALAEWEAALRPAIVRQQRRAYFMRELFVPSNGVMRVIRALLLKIFHRLTIRRTTRLRTALDQRKLAPAAP